MANDPRSTPPTNETPKGQPGAPVPPKVKMANGNGKKETRPIGSPGAQPIGAADTPEEAIKRSTMRIELTTPPEGSAAGSAPRQSTARIDLASQAEAVGGAPRQSTSRIDLTSPAGAAGGAPQQSTARIDLTASAAAARQATSRIELGSVTPAKAAPAPQSQELRKLTTMRIDLSEEVGADGLSGSAEPLRTTSRIELDSAAVAAAAAPAGQQAKKITAHIDLNAAKSPAGGVAPDAVKKITARIELPASMPPEIPPQASEQMPRTIRVKHPGAPTVALKHGTEAAPAAEAGEHGKSQTARIELPTEDIVEQPVTRRKTIRIKRPDGLEPQGSAAAAHEAAPAGAPLAATVMASGEAEPGAAFSLAALAATVIALVLIYVLLAQTLAPNLPFAGKV